MKYADELRRLSRRNPLTNFYEGLLRNLKEEASEGGNHKIITLSKSNYNPVAKKLLNDGFTVVINNYDAEHESHVTYVIWDKEKFDEALKDAKDIDTSTFHYGLI